jgi:hypothetical protein
MHSIVSQPQENGNSAVETKVVYRLGGDPSEMAREGLGGRSFAYR